MSEITLKKIVSGQPALPLGQTAPKVGKTGEFDKVLKEKLIQAQAQTEQVVAKVNSGQLNQLSEVRETIKEASKALHHVIQSRQEIAKAYQKMVQDSKKGG